MNELRLLFEKTGDGAYVVHLDNSWGGPHGKPLPFTSFLEEQDFEDLRWYLEDFMDLPDGGSVVRAQRIEGLLQNWGRRLHDTIFEATENQTLLQELLDHPEPRVFTIGTDEPDLLRLPWELIADAAGPLAARVSVRRQLATPEKLEPRPVVLPLRILYIVSRPGDTSFIDPRLTTRSLFDALDPLGASVHVDFCRPPTLGRMKELLSDAEHARKPYDIIHFDGHGQLGALCFEQPDDGSGEAKMDLVRADRLGALLAAHKIPLVILEACRSAAVGKTAVFRAVAPRLIQAGVSSILSMGHAVHVEAARRLLDRFYRELVRGATIGHAVAQARTALVASPNRWIEYGPQGRTVKLQDWFLPHLYQRGLDERLLPPASPDGVAARPREFDVFLSHNHADSDRVEHLARVLDEKHALRVWLDKWECKPGQLRPQCETGIRNSRYTVVVGSDAALKSKWVEWEIETALAHNPGGAKLVPVKFEDVTLPRELEELLWVDFTDPAQDDANARQLAWLVRSTDGEDARRRRGFRSPATHKDEVGAFPFAPLYGFQGRALELHQLERQFRAHRGIVLHAMAGMGKTALATEAADWWTRSGLFGDGACFLSFETSASAERAIQVLGTYLEGAGFESLPAAEQHRRAIELFDQKDVLVIWDNFESVLPQFNVAPLEADSGTALQQSVYSPDERTLLFDLFRELTASPKGRGRLLVTCRPGETGLPGAGKTELRGLARPDSLWLLARVIAKGGLTFEDARLARDKLDLLLDLLADHPLSIELVCPHLADLSPEQIIADFGQLLAKFKVGAGVERNESLLASLAFSTSRLSRATQAILARLGLFSGGVFECVLLRVSGLDSKSWEAARVELEATALVRVEHDILLGDEDDQRPYLRFHATLVYTTVDHGVQNLEDQRKQFVEIYTALTINIMQYLRGSGARDALQVLAHEEANFRAAAYWAVKGHQYAAATLIGNIFEDYLKRCGRLRERDAWTKWVEREARQRDLSRSFEQRERHEAQVLFNQGQPREAINRMENLIHRLRGATDLDSLFELAETLFELGEILYNGRFYEGAVSVLNEAVARWDAFISQAQKDKHAREYNYLAQALRLLARALESNGLLKQALAVSERALEIQKELGQHRELAEVLQRSGSILTNLFCFQEAATRYDEGIAAAKRAGDKSLEGWILLDQARLARRQQIQHERATILCRSALKRFHEMGDDLGLMSACNLLGLIEQNQGRIPEARAWFERCGEIAARLRHIEQLGAVAQNIAMGYQLEGEAYRQQGLESEARQRFEEAKSLLRESLRFKQQLDSRFQEVTAWSQLAKVHLLLGELEEAERHAHEAREIREGVGLSDAATDYETLADIARARGDAAQIAEWDHKRSTAQRELERRAGYGGLPPEFLRAIQALFTSCARAGAEGIELDADEEWALAQMEKGPEPSRDLAAFLRCLAAGDLPAVPSTVPSELQDFLTQLLTAARAAKGS